MPPPPRGQSGQWVLCRYRTWWAVKEKEMINEADRDVKLPTCWLLTLRKVRELEHAARHSGADPEGEEGQVQQRGGETGVSRYCNLIPWP